MKPLSVLLLASLVVGCATQPEVTVLMGPRRLNTGERDVAVSVLLLQRVGKHGAAACLHESEPTHGPPFNDEDEQVFDSCGAGFRWGGKPR